MKYEKIKIYGWKLEKKYKGSNNRWYNEKKKENERLKKEKDRLIVKN